MTPATDLCREVARVFRARVLGECVPRLRRCVSMLSEAQIWERPNPQCNAIGNLLIHLEGNVRQWIVAGLGGRPDRRNRPAEFSAHEGDELAASRQELVDRLEATVREAVAIVDAATPATLLAVYPFQGGKFPDTGIGCVLHVLEHFSGHSFQVYDRTKQLTGQDLRFYDL